MTSQEYYWKEFYRLKAQANYVELMLLRAEKFDRLIKIFIAVASSSSIGAWVVWKEHAGLWGGIIAASQVLSAIQQHLPYKSRLRPYSALLIELEEIELMVESRWIDISNGEYTEITIRKWLTDLRAKRHLAFKKYIPSTTIPEDGKLFEEAEKRALEYFENFYPQEENHDESESTSTFDAKKIQPDSREKASRATQNSNDAKSATTKEIIDI